MNKVHVLMSSYSEMANAKNTSIARTSVCVVDKTVQLIHIDKQTSYLNSLFYGLI